MTCDEVDTAPGSEYGCLSAIAIFIAPMIAILVLMLEA